MNCKNLDVICRVCMLDGSRNIFQKSTNHKSSTSVVTTIGAAAKTPTTTTTSSENVSSIERLLEKLRYVTMIKIDESESMPYLLCDLCIVQLNVAYNFKRKAVETDTKIRQYVIENGLNVSPSSASLGSLIVEKTTPTPSSLCGNFQQLHYDSRNQHNNVHAPLILKTEPIDYEILSDITIETNTENDENGFHSNNLSNTPRTDTTSTTAEPVNSLGSNFHFQSMVHVIDNQLLKTTTNEDNDFVHKYLTQNQDLTLDKNLDSNEQRPNLIVASKKNSKDDHANVQVELNNTKKDKSDGQKEASTTVPKPKITVKLGKNFMYRELINIRNNLKEKPKEFPNLKEAYPLRNKVNPKTKKDGTGNFKVNPVNRLRQKIKLEKLSPRSSPIVVEQRKRKPPTPTSVSVREKIKDKKHLILEKYAFLRETKRTFNSNKTKQPSVQPVKDSVKLPKGAQKVMFKLKNGDVTNLVAAAPIKKRRKTIISEQNSTAATKPAQ